VQAQIAKVKELMNDLDAYAIINEPMPLAAEKELYYDINNGI